MAIAHDYLRQALDLRLGQARLVACREVPLSYQKTNHYVSFFIFIHMCYSQLESHQSLPWSWTTYQTLLKTDEIGGKLENVCSALEMVYHQLALTRLLHSGILSYQGAYFV